MNTLGQHQTTLPRDTGYKTARAKRDVNVKTLECKARNTARKVGLLARKARRFALPEFHGGFMVVYPETGFPVAGFHYDLEPEGVIAFCKRFAER